MAATEAQVQTEWQAVVDLYRDGLNFASVNASNFIGDQNAIAATLNHNQQYNVELTNVILGSRSRLDGFLKDAIEAHEWVFREYALALATADTPEQDAQSFLTRLYLWFIASGQVVQGRQINYGSPAAGASNVGTGNLYRLNVDQYSYMIENLHMEAKTLLVLADSGSGAQIQEEVSEIRGQAAERDILYLKGSGNANKIQIQGLSARSSQPYIQNASFSEFSPQGTADVAAGSVTGLTGWLCNDFTKLAMVAGLTAGTEYYRDFPGDNNPFSVQFTGTATLYIQQFMTNPGYLTAGGAGSATGWYAGNQANFDPDVPIYCHVAVKPSGAADGNLAITFGAITVTYTGLSGLSLGAWNRISVLVGANAWFRQFNSNTTFPFKINWSGQSTGTLTIDDVTIGPYTACDGGWYAQVGASTRFQRFDTFTFTDALFGSDGVIAYWLWALFSRFLPGAPPTPSTAPSAALAGAGAGNIENGTHSYKVSFVDGNGIEGPVSAASSTVNVVDKTTNGKVTVSSIPLGPTGTTKRKVYRTATANAAPWKLLTNGTIADNVTTSLLDNDADASRGASAPTITAFADPT